MNGHAGRQRWQTERRQVLVALIFIGVLVLPIVAYAIGAYVLLWGLLAGLLGR